MKDLSLNVTKSYEVARVLQNAARTFYATAESLYASRHCMRHQAARWELIAVELELTARKLELKLKP